MGVLTNLLKLLKPGENDYYNQQTEQADNWDKVDNYAVLTNTDKNGIWGGEYGGKIQDPIPKELNKRYIDNINGKAFICIKSGGSSVVSNTIEYFTPCNVVDNLDKLQNLVTGTEGFNGHMTIGKYTINWGYLLCDNANFTIGTLSKPFTKTALQSFANYDYPDSKKKVAVSSAPNGLDKIKVFAGDVDTTAPGQYNVRYFIIGI